MINLDYLMSFPELKIVDYLLTKQVFGFRPNRKFLLPEEEGNDIQLYMCIQTIENGVVYFSVYNEFDNTSTEGNRPKDVYTFFEEWSTFCENGEITIIEDVVLKAKLLLLI